VFTDRSQECHNVHGPRPHDVAHQDQRCRRDSWLRPCPPSRL
jgi:hypothetical protein